MALAWQSIDLSEDPDEVWFLGNPAELIHLDDLVLALLRRPSWHARAACRGRLSTMFIERGVDARPAKQLCESCPVRDQCLAAGMVERQGVWGGTSERQRRQLRRHAA